jgi:hypothetical protein
MSTHALGRGGFQPFAGVLSASSSADWQFSPMNGQGRGFTDRTRRTTRTTSHLGRRAVDQTGRSSTGTSIVSGHDLDDAMAKRAAYEAELLKARPDVGTGKELTAFPTTRR